jgi:hypothetical protein
METKEIIIFVCAFLALGFSIYRKMSGKNNNTQQGEKRASLKKGGFSSQPDDYEPYSGKKS